MQRLSSAARRLPLGRVPARGVAQWLQGKPPAVNVDAGTLGAWYYKNVRGAETGTKDFVNATQQDEKFTVAQFDTRVHGFACGMLDGMGLKKGSKVVLWMSNELEAAAMQYSAALAGATVVTIDAGADIDTVLEVLAKEEPRVLVYSTRVGQDVRTPRVRAAFPELEAYNHETGYFPLSSKRFRSLKYILETGGEDELAGIVRMEDLPVYGGAEGAGEVMAGLGMDPVAAAQSYVAAADTAAVYYGAAAGGKAMTATHTDVLATASAAAGAMGLKSTDTVVVTAPLTSHFGFAAGCVAAAGASAKTVIPSKVFDAARTLAAATQQRATALVATASQAAALAAELAADAAKAKKAYDLSALRTGLVVDAAAPVTLGGATLKPVNAAKFPGKAAF